tara:strand:+ start:251 stop:943 length:693 start_codon:yes stop_codon:yes gene_type:complete
MFKITTERLKKLMAQHWIDELNEEFKSNYFMGLVDHLNRTNNLNLLCPKIDDIFKCYNSNKLKNIKVVILGQDPYHGANQANGLAFAVNNNIKLPPSLKNIFIEISNDLSMNVKVNSTLENFSNQGVFLLNTSLTVVRNRPNSHKDIGWEIFTNKTIKIISQKRENIVFMLWGKSASKKRNLINEDKHLVLTTSHPSPLSAYRGFFGSKHFSKANQFLKEKNIEEINWVD